MGMGNRRGKWLGLVSEEYDGALKIWEERRKAVAMGTKHGKKKSMALLVCVRQGTRDAEERSCQAIR
jgi:hypothetical protein